MDGGSGISVLCVWLRPNSFVHVLLSPANHIQQLENDDLPDRLIRFLIKQNKNNNLHIKVYE